MFSNDGVLTVRTYEFFREDDQFGRIIVDHPRKFAQDYHFDEEDLNVLMFCGDVVRGWRCQITDVEVVDVKSS